MPSTQLEPYAQGYRDGWHDRRIRHTKRRRVRRRANREYGLGYNHGWADGEGRDVDWWPDFAAGVTNRAAAGGIVPLI